MLSPIRVVIPGNFAVILLKTPAACSELGVIDYNSNTTQNFLRFLLYFLFAHTRNNVLINPTTPLWRRSSVTSNHQVIDMLQPTVNYHSHGSLHSFARLPPKEFRLELRDRLASSSCNRTHCVRPTTTVSGRQPQCPADNHSVRPTTTVSALPPIWVWGPNCSELGIIYYNSNTTQNFLRFLLFAHTRNNEEINPTGRYSGWVNQRICAQQLSVSRLKRSFPSAIVK